MHILPILHRMHTMTIHYLAFKILPEAQQTQASRSPRCPRPQKKRLKLKLHQKLKQPGTDGAKLATRCGIKMREQLNLCPSAPPFLLLRVHSLLLHSPTAHLHIQPKPYLDLGLKMDPKWRRPSEASPFTYN